MSKTETQSEALTPQLRLRFAATQHLALCKKFGPEGFKLDLPQDDVQEIISLLDRAERLDAENKALRERLAADIDPALSREVYRACEDLPEDWAIRIDLENGYGGVKLIDPDGEESELPVDGMLSDAMRLTIDAAMAAAKTGDAA